MNLNWNPARLATVKFNTGVLSLALALSTCSPHALAQSAPAAQTTSDLSIETFYLTNLSRFDDSNDIRNAVSNLLSHDTPVIYSALQNAIIVRGTPDQLALARKIISALDRTKSVYRLTYTLNESDGGKRIGTQHVSLILVSGQRTTLKQGSKVPVATGSYSSGGASSQTQFTYLDVGINLDATVDDSPNGVRLRSKVEQSGIAESATVAKVTETEPIIRQSVLEGTSIITLGKPLILGSVDVPGSTRHLDIEAVVEVVK